MLHYFYNIILTNICSIKFQVFEDEAITDDEDEDSSEDGHNNKVINKSSRNKKQNTIKYESDEENACEAEIANTENVLEENISESSEIITGKK